MNGRWEFVRISGRSASRCIISVLLILIPITVSCGSGGARMNERNQQPAAGGLDRLPPPSVLRDTSYYPYEVIRNGSEYVRWSGFFQNASTVGNYCELAPNWTPDAPDPAGLAFACYSMGTTEFDRPNEIHFFWDQPADPDELWIGLSDYSSDSWYWQQYPEGDTLAVDFEPFINPRNDRMCVLVLATGTTARQLTRIQIGDLATLTGKVFEADGVTPLYLAEVVLDGPDHFTRRTNLDGAWSVIGAPPGEYEVSVYLVGWTFEPESLQLTVDSLVQEVDAFTGSQPAVHTVSGLVRQSNGTPISSVNMRISTDGSEYGAFFLPNETDGTWAIDLPDGTYAVQPFRLYWSFLPQSQEFTVGGGDVEIADFIGSLVLRRLEGYVYLDDGVTPLSGVTVYLSDNWEYDFSALTDHEGHYVFPTVFENEYALYPLKSGYTFEPQSRDIVVDSDMTIDPFLATPN